MKENDVENNISILINFQIVKFLMKSVVIHVVDNDIHLAMLYMLHVCILLFLFVFSHMSTCVNVDIITPREGIAKRS